MKNNIKLAKAIALVHGFMVTAVFGQSFGLYDADRSWIGIQSGSSTNFFTVWNSGTGTINGASLNSSPFTSASDSLLVKAFDIKTFKSGGADVQGGTFWWTVYETGNRSNLSFNSQSLNFLENIGSGGDQKWGFTGANINLLSASAVTFVPNTIKSYTFEFYTQINGTFSSGGSVSQVYDNNNGAASNYTATFTTVPEPSSASLVALGAAGLLALRRRRNA
ncbi:MAG: PEP-CTERM sorting domain-containing protein [Flavobacteriia bacterium]|nr:PEP-CTERM sorting domain-containing protein [Flavobacteriia bacterium]